MEKKVDSICEICGKSFSHKDNKNVHIIKIHKPNEAKHKCDFCDYRGVHPRDIRYHLDRVHKKTTFDCDQCDSKFAYEHYLKKHMKFLHENKGECPVCNKVVVALKEHMKRLHDNERPKFKCDVCQKELATQIVLDQHKRTHDPNREKHTCDHCGNEFVEKMNLRRHLEIHKENRRMFPCDVCNKEFVTKVYMKNHKKAVHEGLGKQVGFPT